MRLNISVELDDTATFQEINSALCEAGVLAGRTFLLQGILEVDHERHLSLDSVVVWNAQVFRTE